MEAETATVSAFFIIFARYLASAPFSEIMLKRRPKYRVRIYDEAHLVDRGGFSVSWLKVSLIGFAIMVFFILIGIGIVWFTPLQKRLPGYMPPEQRAKSEQSILQVDSLRQLYTVHQAYLDNLVRVLDTNRRPDLPDTVGNAIPLIPDSLLVSSEIELKFLKKMEEAGYVITINEDYSDTISNE